MKYFLTIAAFLLAACSTALQTAKSDPPTPDVTADEKAIKSTLIDMWDAIEKGDIQRYASHVHPDFTSFGETAEKLRSGKEAEVKAIREWVEEPTDVHTEMNEPVVTVKGDTAWITYYWSDQGTSKGVPFATKGKSTRIFVRENGNWLCIHGHYTLLE